MVTQSHDVRAAGDDLLMKRKRDTGTGRGVLRVDDNAVDLAFRYEDLQRLPKDASAWSPDQIPDTK